MHIEKGRANYYIRTFVPLYGDAGLIVGYEFTANCRNGTRSTHSGTIRENGVFKCSDHWYSGHGTQGQVGCLALDMLYKQLNKDMNYYPWDRKWVHQYFWTETWLAQMSVLPPSHAIDVHTLKPYQLMPPPAHAKRGRPKGSRYTLSPMTHPPSLTCTFSRLKHLFL